MDDIARGTDGADKKFGGFEKRRTYFFESGGVKKDAGFFLDPLPLFDLAGKDVLHPGKTLVFCRHNLSSTAAFSL